MFKSVVATAFASKRMSARKKDVRERRKISSVSVAWSTPKLRQRLDVPRNSSL